MISTEQRHFLKVETADNLEAVSFQYGELTGKSHTLLDVVQTD